MYKGHVQEIQSLHHITPLYLLSLLICLNLLTFSVLFFHVVSLIFSECCVLYNVFKLIFQVTNSLLLLFNHLIIQNFFPQQFIFVSLLLLVQFGDFIFSFLPFVMIILYSILITLKSKILSRE